MLRSFPLFLNFDRNITPAFLLKLVHQDVPAVIVFVDKMFGMCGGWDNTIEIETDAGVPESSNPHRMRVQVCMEWVEREPGRSFFFTVSKCLARTEAK